MALFIGLDRYKEILKNAFRVVGPDAYELSQTFSGVYDLSADHPEFDDQVAYWYTPVKALAALAANFSTVACAVTGSGRFVVDGVSILPPAALTAYNIGITSQPVAGGVAAFQANAFAIRAGNASPQTLGVVTIISEQSVGGRLGNAGYPVTAPANTGLQLSWRNGSLPPYVLTPATGGGTAFNLVVESTAVNQALAAAFWGRWFPESFPG